MRGPQSFLSCRLSAWTVWGPHNRSVSDTQETKLRGHGRGIPPISRSVILLIRQTRREGSQSPSSLSCVVLARAIITSSGFNSICAPSPSLHSGSIQDAYDISRMQIHCRFLPGFIRTSSTRTPLFSNSTLYTCVATFTAPFSHAPRDLLSLS
jgi:hypothetical protein